MPTQARLTIELAAARYCDRFAPAPLVGDRCHRVTYVDVDAFEALINAQREVSELGGRLVLAAIRDTVQGYLMLHWMRPWRI